MKTILRFRLVLLAILGSIGLAWAGPGTTSVYIKVDQFGYKLNANKVAIIVDPQNGYNASESFNPSTGANAYQVRRWSDNVVVYSGTLAAYKNGATHTQSGDKGWWFDFSSVTTAGSYYIYDTGRAVGSYRFEIADNVYDEVLKQAVRTFYYQRINYAKTTTYAGTKWTDAASHTQDNAVRDLSGNNPKNLSGGWYDAGDYGKYTTFLNDVLPVMLEAYREYPNAFKDNYNIPESGNGVADLLDEIKWEYDWLKRMQDATGNGGLYLKVGANNYNDVTPPSTDARQRYYYPECTSATISGALNFAIGALVYKNVSAYASYGNDLQTRAVNAWNRAVTATSNFTSFQTACDDGQIKSGDADVPQTSTEPAQLEIALSAAVYLYELTGNNTYKTFVESKYTQVRPYQGNYWHGYRAYIQNALLRYTQLTGISTTVRTNILASLSNDGASGEFSLTAWNNQNDLYRAPIPDYAYRWGSNMVKANAGMMALNKAKFLNTNVQSYNDLAEGFLHYMHGVNPQGLVYLSNMDSYGSEKSVNEFYHTWFKDGSAWDNAKTSPKGPPPGYVTGGPNYWYAIENGGSTSISPPAGQPHQKSYKDWNSHWNGTFSEASYSVTENAIYYQAKYINLLARIIKNVNANTPTTTTNIYTDALASDWGDWSWGTAVTNNPNNTSPIKAGTKSLATTLNGNGGLSLRKGTATSTSGYTGIKFWVHGGTGSNKAMRFYSQNADSGGNSTQVNFTATANTWNEISITLSQLGNPTSIKRINFQNTSASAQSVIYFDEIRLVGGGGRLNAETSTDVPTEAEATLQVYPNPARHTLNVTLGAADGGTWQLQLVDMQGRPVIQHYHSDSENPARLNISQLPNGQYLLRAIDASRQAAKRIFVANE
jgi:endoglucanase